jgi:hypothetical protein
VLKGRYVGALQVAARDMAALRFAVSWLHGRRIPQDTMLGLCAWTDLEVTIIKEIYVV